ncbi:MAG: 6-pyruvoyl-tetrahydropterin synthase-related protein, partial [Chloroflexota bacterium]|nr:6-pyruvoyl-tetrahydropterin synthase-related protein [Chloroflexota bacterium]
MRRHAASVVLLLTAFGLTLLAIRAFALLLAGPHFPWSEDAAGHVYKSTVLIESLRAGHGVPILFPGWYAGSEAFRYWPHLPYFLLAIPLAIAPSDPGLAVIVIIAAGLIASGAGVLLWRRRLGWPLAILGTILGALLADPVRVAFGEGNLPRVVAHALFLPELALALAVARADRWHPWPRPALALIGVAMLSVLCHAMMATAAGAAIVLVLLAGNLTRRWEWRRTLAVVGLIAIGTALAGWWLAPSLGGGIAGTSSEAVRRGLLHYDPREAAPFVRTGVDRAYFHVGIALIVAAVAALRYGGRRGNGFPYLAAGLPLVLVVFDPLALLYIELPFGNLLWPVRLQSVGQVLVLLGLLHTASDVLRASGPLRIGRQRLARA